MPRSDLSPADLRSGYTLTVAQLAQLLHVSRHVVYRHLIDGYGNPAGGGDATYLAYLGRRVPVERDHNGDIRFLTARATEVFDLGHSLHPSVYPAVG